MRLFSEFYQSDIIVASPLALVTLLGEKPGDGEATGGAADFLSSVELAVVARADVLSMQNWAHVKMGACRPAKSVPTQQYVGPESPVCMC